MSDKNGGKPGADPEGGGRRAGDRREAQVPFAGPDRRKGDRRTAADRRTTPRITGDMDDDPAGGD